MTITSADPTTSTPATGPDPEQIGAFIGQLLGHYVSAGITNLVDVGSRTGLFEALAAGPATADGLADRSGLSARHVREWLGGVATAGIVDYDPASATFSLPLERAICLTGDSSANVAPMARGVTFLARFAPAVARTLEEGGGIPYSEYLPEFTDVQDGMNRRVFDEQLVDGHLAAVPGLIEKLGAGIRVLDIGCGSGHVVNLIGRAFPASTVVGYDLADSSLAKARAEADAWGLTNVRFEKRDVATLPTDERFDLVTAFDVIHDQVKPRTVLAEVRRVLAAEGTFLMVDMNLSSNLEDNIGNPIAPWFYTVSLFHCMQVSLAEGGEGLGTAWGRQQAQELLAEAGFGAVELLPAPPGDPVNVLYWARPA